MQFPNTRDYKIFTQDHCYHIYNRGNNRDPVFKDDQDYIVFLDRVKRVLNIAPDIETAKCRITPLPAKAFSILCFVAMPNHFHFLIRQNGNVPITKFITKLCTSYGKYFNKKYERVGHVWQDAFKAKLVLDDSYLRQLVKYIIHNPVNYKFNKYSSLAELNKKVSNPVTDFETLFKVISTNKVQFLKYVETDEQLTIPEDLLLE